MEGVFVQPRYESSLSTAIVLTSRAAIPAVRAHPTRITSLEEAFAIRNIGKKTAEKVGTNGIIAAGSELTSFPR